ncbi:phytoene/squalene synthase family protein [Novosphingobium lentum]|uniref:phytoene/squalene synthase family protein n=1 Tax=Novosphingobium lentum TaxID=145287 RepID=UPI000832FF79|nr:phytoene/squalene synthase family protein [Novosphingobium lentum]
MDRAELVSHARQTIERGSKSFAAASRLFDFRTRERVWLLYAWCRRCDDLADAQDLGGRLGDQRGAADRLATIRDLTARALTGDETGDSAFDALGVVARETGLTSAMAEAVIAGFALDAADWQPRTEADLMRYCWHVAGAVGVMMAVVMGVPPGDAETLDQACDLGLAFQLANIARDLEEDDAADRCYLPLDWLVEADIPPGEQMKPHYRAALVPLVARMCHMAHAHECSARIGAGRLTFRQRWAVLSAAAIYGEIAHDVERRGAHAWDHRTVVSSARKLGFILKAAGLALGRPARACREGASHRRWTRRQLEALAA